MNTHLQDTGIDAATASGWHGADSGSTRPAAPLRVLVADDNRDTTVLLRMRLQRMGHDVRTVNDGAAALNVVADYQPDLVIMDLGMPGVDGHTAAREIRRLPTGAHILLVALTGYDDDADRRRSVEAGFDCHLVKPLEEDELESLLRKRRPQPPST